LKPDHALVPFYQQAASLMKKNPHVTQAITEIIHGCEQGNPELLRHAKKIYSQVLEGIIQSLERLNIILDSFIEESKFLLDGSVHNVITRLTKTPYSSKEGTALYLNLEKFGIHGRNKKFFLTRNDGTSLYATRDIAYHIWKGKNADGMINILGEDHKLEARQVAIALDLMGAACPTNVFYSFVSLPEGRMSTRKGQVVYLDDLINEAVDRAKKEVQKRRDLSQKDIQIIAEHVGIGAIRYNLIKVQTDKPITFRWEEALNFEGESAPFIQYAYARCCSILAKTDKESVSNPLVLNHKTERDLVKKLAEFPEVIIRSVHHHNPSYLAEYGYHLAASWNQFYRDCRVIDDQYEKERLALVQATRQVLKNTLTLLGIQALESM
jgi:arginyl-tRNA synthetase